MAIVINKADATCTVSGYSGYFDYLSHGATGFCSGIGGEAAGTLDLGRTFTNPPGGAAHWVFTGNRNYSNQSGDVSVEILNWIPSGYYQPVDMNGTWNTVKSGSTVPLKFELFAGTTEKTDVTAVEGFTIKGVACPVTGLVTDDVELTTTGGTTLRYDLLIPSARLVPGRVLEH